MKIIKKIAAFMFAFIMVISMGSHVMAAGGEGTLGTITINNAVAGQEYKLYKILTLESYDEGNKLYSYKPASEAWKAFLISEPAKEYVNVNEYDGVTWVEKDDETIRPSIKDKVSNMDSYQNIYIGFPVWWYKEPNIIDTFI